MERRTPLSLKEKRQRRPQSASVTRSDRSSSSHGDQRFFKVQAGRQGRKSLKGVMRRAATSHSSSLDRLLQDVATSSDDHIERKVQEVKKMTKLRAESHRSAEEDGRRSASVGSMTAPDLFKRLRQSGMSPLQVGKVAAELQ
eukprot:6481788-Amphidinium_carterae.1